MPRHNRLLIPVVSTALAFGCGDEDKKSDASDSDTRDSSSETSPPGDTVEPDGDIVDPDTAPPDDTLAPDGDTSTTDPGALLALRMEATVGVLLDEVPASARARLLAQLEDKDEAFWRERAVRQVEFTSYRLIFRNFYYEEGEGKHILPLPPVDTWDIVFSSAPEVRTIDGHQVLARDYTFTSTLLGPEDEAVKADARLDAPGKVVEETYVLPVDPEHVFERTGYACMNEEDFPPNSVDTENARLFYDDLCEGSVLIENGGCHLSYPIPDESCVDAVKAKIGSVETAVTFERLAWDEAIANDARRGAQLPGVAELRALPEGVADNRIVYRWIEPDSCAIAEGCVGGSGWRRLLQFTATVQNLGAVDALLGDVSPGSGPYDNRLVSMSECHGHMHFNHYGAFAFGEGEAGANGGKRAFCVESTWRYFNNEDTPFTHPYTCTYQGTAAGWGDDYIAGLDCQWVDVTDIDTSEASYDSTLTFHVNPDKFLCEGEAITDASGALTFEPTEFTNEAGEIESRIACEEIDGAADNNVATAPVTLPAGTGGLITEPCTRGQIGPARNCGFSAPDDTITCAAGEIVNFTCRGGSETAPAAVRICEASGKLGAIPCTYNDALANKVVAGADIKFEVACPAVRDAASGENGGLVGLYGAPLIPGDAFTLSCNRE